ncbi:hypothetical protein ACQPTN_24905 [Bradyrhizobium sp. 13971]
MTAQIVKFPQQRESKSERLQSLNEELDRLLEALTPRERRMVEKLCGILEQLAEAGRCA